MVHQYECIVCTLVLFPLYALYAAVPEIDETMWWRPPGAPPADAAAGTVAEDAGAIEAAMQALFMDGLAGQCF